MGVLTSHLCRYHKAECEPWYHPVKWHFGCSPDHWAVLVLRGMVILTVHIILYRSLDVRNDERFILGVNHCGFSLHHTHKQVACTNTLSLPFLRGMYHPISHGFILIFKHQHISYLIKKSLQSMLYEALLFRSWFSWAEDEPVCIFKQELWTFFTESDHIKLWVCLHI